MGKHDVTTVGHVGIQPIVYLVKRTCFFVCIMERCGSLSVALSGVLVGETEQPGKGWCFAAYAITWFGLTASHHRFDHKFKKSDGKINMVVFVYYLTKIVGLFPCNKEVTTIEYARLFVNWVFRSHGVPEVIISDRGTRFFNTRRWFSLLERNSQSAIYYCFSSRGRSFDRLPFCVGVMLLNNLFLYVLH